MPALDMKCLRLGIEIHLEHTILKRTLRPRALYVHTVMTGGLGSRKTESCSDDPEAVLTAAEPSS